MPLYARLHLSVRNGNLVACRLGSWQRTCEFARPTRPTSRLLLAIMTNYCQGLCLACWIMVETFLWCKSKMNMALMEKISLIYEQFGNWWKTEGLIAHSLLQMAHGGLLWKPEPWSKTISLWQETSVLKLRTTFHRCRNSLMSMARNGPSCVWNSGMVGSTVGKNPSSLVILKNWQKLFERYWSKALSTFTCSMVVQTLVSWMVARLEELWICRKSHLTTMMPFSMKKEIQLLNT